MKSSRYRKFTAITLLMVLACGTALAGSAEQNTYIRLIQSGMEHLKAGDHGAARDTFSEALKYNDGDANAHLGLGLAYFHLREDNSAERELLQAVLLDPDSWVPHQWLGELAYRNDDLESAVKCWQKAVDLNSSDRQLRARLERVRREQGAEKDFNRDVTSHFLIKYEGREKIQAGRIVLRILEDAYSELGRSLAYYPEREIQVILYSNQQFQEVTDAPGWSGGIYDGKIRIPIGGIQDETPGLRALLLHEYCHAVVQAITRNCPTWLNEGLAQHFEGRNFDARQEETLRKTAAAEKVPSLSSLEGSFMGLNGNQAMFAYLFSYSAVRYIIDNFGMYRVKNILDELAAGADIRTAIDAGLSLPYDEFERGWSGSLK